MDLNKLINKFHMKALFLFGTIALFILFSWFRYGLVYGGGDVGLTTYNPKRIAEVISKIWWEDTAPGFPRPQGLASLPTEVVLSVLQNFGLPFYLIQASLFGVLIFLMGLGMYFLALDLFGKDKKGMALLAGLFYVVNPYMMVQVWHRFVHSTFFLAAGLPFILLFWIRWINKRKLTDLLLFILFNFIFSFLYSTMAYVVTVWGVLTFYAVFVSLFPWQGFRNVFKVSLNYLIGFVFWILTNVWWLGPVLLVTPSLLSSQHSLLSSILTLIAISNQSVIPYSLAGLNPFYLFYQQELGETFINPLFLFIPWIAVIFIFIGFYFALKKRNLVFLPILFVLAIFFAKGMAAPFGYPFLYGFTKSFILGVLRNPFEKIGILIPLSGSLLFALGFIKGWNFFTKKRAVRIILIFFMILFFGLYHWPFWTGHLLGKINRPNFVEVPIFYQQANEWISVQKKEGNILHLPLPVSEGVSYFWPYGYSGVDSTTDFFTSNPSISMGFNLNYLDNALETLNLLNEVSFEEEKIKQLMRVFNVRFIVLHHEINWQKSAVRDPYKVGRVLDNLRFLKKQKEFGGLTIYEISESDFLDKLYIQDNFDYLAGVEGDIPKFRNSWSYFLRYDPSQLLISDFNKGKSQFSQNHDLLILPEKSTGYYLSEQLNEENALQQLPAVRFLPNSPFYPFIKIKEAIQLWGSKDTLSNLYLEYAGKRLVEAYKLQESIPAKSITPQIKDYISTLPKAMDRLDEITKATTISKEVPSQIKQLLNNHRIILDSLAKKSIPEDKKLIEQAMMILNQRSIDQAIIPLFQTKSDQVEYVSEQVNRFSIPRSGEYEMVMADSQVVDLYEDNLDDLSIQVDNSLEKRKAYKGQLFISYGSINLTEGAHEITYPRINSVNLFSGFGDDNQMEIASSQHNQKIFETNISPFNPGSTYAIFFDFWVKKGNDPRVRILQDSDPVDLGGIDISGKERSYQYDYKINIDPYNKYWRNFTYLFDSRKNSAKLSLQIIVDPWNDCESILGYRKFLCGKREIVKNYERPSEIVIKNLKIFRVLTNPLFLRSKGESTQSAQVTRPDFTKREPLKYEGSFSLEKPAFLVLSQTFDKDWQLFLTNGAKTKKVQAQLIANMYANAYFIEQLGEYKFKLEYMPQNYFYLGIVIGIISTLILLIIVVFIKIKGLFSKGNYESS